MKFGSVCSGIEAASVAWEPLGFKAAFFSEIEKFPCNLLKNRYPHVPNLGDMTKFKDWHDYAIDLLVGGTPCQSFSVAGLRKGLSDPRGNLALTFLAIAQRYQPRWIVWENVPGVLSSSKGRDFGAFLGGLAKLGYGWAYRVLDAQYCRVDGFPRAVPQSRRRVFVVGYLGDMRCAAAVLLDAKSLRRDPAPCREAGQGIAGTLSSRTSGGGGLGTDFDLNGGLQTSHDISPTLIAREHEGPLPEADLSAVAFSSKDRGADAQDDVAPTLRAMGHANSHQNGGGQVAVAFPLTSGMSRSASRMPQEQGALVPQAYNMRGREDGAEMEGPRDIASLRAGDGGSSRSYVAADYAVRRLTPTECERLQGFPDNYTLVPHTHGKPAADGPRYKALGNSMAVNVMRVLGARIKMVDDILVEIS